MYMKVLLMSVIHANEIGFAVARGNQDKDAAGKRKKKSFVMVLRAWGAGFGTLDVATDAACFPAAAYLPRCAWQP